MRLLIAYPQTPGRDSPGGGVASAEEVDLELDVPLVAAGIAARSS